ncbi:uncharacterized protein [Nicotiana tomentosiformis]|uniref:uncharacterized protein n=1 Tax=Nicotiana tomentosiformis TaxID=4098 RepID=UPI00388C8181
MTVTQNETRFVDLARYAVFLLPTKRERLRRFIDGLAFGMRLQMAKETKDDISFQRTIEITRRIEMIHSQGRDALSEKRTRQFGGFSGASSRVGGSFGRGYPPRPIQSTLQASHSSSSSSGSYGNS